MSKDISIQIQHPNTTIEFNNPSITIEVPDHSTQIEFQEGQPLEIQIQHPNIVVELGCQCGSGSGSGGHTIIDETTPLPQRSKLRFTGSGVTATDDSGNDTTVVTIPGGGGGAGITEITYADAQTAITNSALTPGAYYNITDAAGTDGGFICVAVSENAFDVSGTGIFLNADFQNVGDYSGVEGVTGVAPTTNIGIWQPSFEEISFDYLNLSPDYVTYLSETGPLNDGEAYTTDLANTGTIIHDDGAGTATLIPDQPLVSGEVITGTTSGNILTVDAYTNPAFSVGDTIAGQTSGTTATITADSGTALTVLINSGGPFVSGETVDNGSGVTADLDGSATAPTIQQGDIVIWNLRHWQMKDAGALDGAAPSGNADAYTLLEKTEINVGYVLAYDLAEFDFDFNWLQYRGDLRGNKVRMSRYIGDLIFELLESPVPDFQFGRDLWVNNTIQNAHIRQKNSVVSMRGCAFYEGAYFYGGTHIINSYLQNLILYPYSFLLSVSLDNNAALKNSVFQSFGSIRNSSFGVASFFDGNTIYQNGIVDGLNIGNGGNTNNNIIENGGQITGITAGVNCSISRNKVGQGAVLGGGTTMGDGAQYNDLELQSSSSVILNNLGNGAQISSNVYGKNSGSSQLTLGVNSFVSNCYFFEAIEGYNIPDGMYFSQSTVGKGIGISKYTTLSESVNLKIAEKGFSNFQESFDVSGLSTLDWLPENNFVGIANLTSSNASEALDTISNAPGQFPITIKPAAGLTLTVTGTAIVGIAAGQIALKAASYTLDGSKGEYIVLESDPTNTYLVEKQVVNGLI